MNFLFPLLSGFSLLAILVSVATPDESHRKEPTTLERDEARLQNFFKRSQSTCNDKVGVYKYKHHPYAHFSVIHVISNSFLEAVASGHLFVHPESDRSEYISGKR